MKSWISSLNEDDRETQIEKESQRIQFEDR